MTTENIIKSIEDNRQELISKYFAISEAPHRLYLMAMGCENRNEADSLWCERAELTYKKSELFTAINDLGNALGHLGHSVETFWGK